MDSTISSLSDHEHGPLRPTVRCRAFAVPSVSSRMFRLRFGRLSRHGSLLKANSGWWRARARPTGPRSGDRCCASASTGQWTRRSLRPPPGRHVPKVAAHDSRRRCCVRCGHLGAARLSAREPAVLALVQSRSAFAGFRFPSDVIVVAVRWYLRFNLSYRDVEELLTERRRSRSRHHLSMGAALHAAADRGRSAGGDPGMLWPASQRACRYRRRPSNLSTRARSSRRRSRPPAIGHKPALKDQPTAPTCRFGACPWVAGSPRSELRAWAQALQPQSDDRTHRRPPPPMPHPRRQRGRFRISPSRQ